MVDKKYWIEELNKIDKTVNQKIENQRSKNQNNVKQICVQKWPQKFRSS